MIFETIEPIDNPIEFKQINPSDFPTFEIEGGEKVIIEPSPEGYISEQIFEQVDFSIENTVVVNAGVGQGKSFATIKLISKLFEDLDENGEHKYVLIITAPYKTLIEQYKQKLLESLIQEHHIFDYRELENPNSVNLTRVTKLPIHIITIKSFLGDYGESAIEQSSIKREYLKGIIEYCETNNKKVVIFLDEVHDSIASFKEKFIYNLWNWEKVIHKIFALSATYNESSKLVIQYLAELTQDRIQIIECERKRLPDKQSDLQIHFLNRGQYSADDNELVEIVKAQLDRGKKIDILCYSKTLAEQICQQDNPSKGLKKSELGKILGTVYSSVNLCTSDSGGVFDPSSSTCNIGTNFKTGVSIEDDNASFIVIMPPRKVNSFGIFSDGINSVIQAFARPRKKATIVVIMPIPEKLIAPKPDSSNYDDVIKSMGIAGLSAANYFDINKQTELLEAFYKQAKENVTKGAQRIEEKRPLRPARRPKLEFPHLSTFILEDGEKVLYMRYEMFGKDLSAYITWAAANNQFLNCKLSGIYRRSSLRFNKGRILAQLIMFYEDNFGSYFPTILYSDLAFYKEFRERLFRNLVFIDGEKKDKYSSVIFERSILGFTQLWKKDNKPFEERAFIVDEHQNSVIEDIQIDKDYLLACFANAVREDIPNTIGEETKGLIEAYKTILTFKTKIEDSIRIDKLNRPYLLRDNYFAATHTLNIEELVSIVSATKRINDKDIIISNGIVSFLQTIAKSTPDYENLDWKIKTTKSLYSEMRKLFYLTKEIRIRESPEVLLGVTNGNADNRQLELLDKVMLPPATTVLNFLFEPQDEFEEYSKSWQDQINMGWVRNEEFYDQ